MIDSQKHVHYWKAGAEEDWAAACQLVATDKARHGLFFAHLALEKLLKAHFCRHSGELAPRSHNLVRLAELAALVLSPELVDRLAAMNAFNLEGRYPDDQAASPTPEEGRRYLAKAEEVFTWLITTL